MHAVDLSSILSSNLMVLHLLNYLLHVLTCVLQLCELFLEADVEGFEGDDFLGWRHTLDSGEQVVSNIIRSLKHVVLLQINLSHARVLNLVNRFFLFDELLHAA